MKKEILVVFLVLVFATSFASAMSNESIQAKELLDEAGQSLSGMEKRNISIVRVDELFQEALQLYEAQVIYERAHKDARYSQVIDNSEEIIKIRNDAFRAQDELKIFLEAYDSYVEKINLSEMDEEYNNIISSFEDELFENTIELIAEGYERLSEVQSSQTTLRLFYSTTSRTLKSFLEEHWLKLVIGFLVIIIAIVILWTTIQRLRIRHKLKELTIRKETIKKLIKKLQYNYFERKSVSALEYKIKLNKFTELIRDIDRQVPLLKEEMLKLGKEEIGKEKQKKKFEKQIRRDVKKRLRVERKEDRKVKQKVTKTAKVIVKKKSVRKVKKKRKG